MRIFSVISSLRMYYIAWVLFFCKQKTAYEMRISDWSSDVCSSDLLKGSQALKDAVALVSDSVVLPAGFEVVFERCGEINAYYYAESGNVSMCYELVTYFAELYENDSSEE